MVGNRSSRRPDRQRHATDVENVLAIQLEGLGGPTWAKVRRDLWGYAANTLPGQLRKGTLLSAMRGHGIPVTDTDVAAAERLGRASDSAVHDLVQDVVIRTLDGFGVKLCTLPEKGGWDPALETTVGSYFLGDCYWKFLDALRKWERARRRERGVRDQVRDEVALSPHLPDVAHLALDRVVVRTELEGLDEQDTVLVVLQSLEFSYGEVGDRVGLTERQVEYRTTKAQRQARTRRDAILRAVDVDVA